MDNLTLSLLTLSIASALMMGTWIISIRIKNAGIVDVVRSSGFTLLQGFYLIFGKGWLPRKILISTMVTLWSLRLGGYLFKRVRSLHPQEDARYAEFRSHWGSTFNTKMFGFFQIQALLLWVLTFPFLLSCSNVQPKFEMIEWIGLLVWIIGLGGESLADFQLAQFLKNQSHRGKICKVGLWKYSRHPNYFFEWVIWISYFLFALGQPNGVWTIYCPLVMLHFLVNVTGVKLSEKGSVARRGEAYREYQRTTSAFIPWFPKRGLK